MRQLILGVWMTVGDGPLVSLPVWFVHEAPFQSAWESGATTPTEA